MDLSWKFCYIFSLRLYLQLKSLIGLRLPLMTLLTGSGHSLVIKFLQRRSLTLSPRGLHFSDFLRYDMIFFLTFYWCSGMKNLNFF